MDAKEYREAVAKYNREAREALEHLESVIGTPEAYVAGIALQAKVAHVSSMPERIQDLPLAHPVKNEEEAQARADKPKYAHVHKWQRKPSFEDRVKAVSAEKVKQMNFDLEELRRRREASTYRRMNWEDVLMVQAGKPHKQNRDKRKGNGKGRPPLSLEYLREKELNGKHLD